MGAVVAREHFKELSGLKLDQDASVHFVNANTQKVQTLFWGTNDLNCSSSGVVIVQVPVITRTDIMLKVEMRSVCDSKNIQGFFFFS